MRLIYHISSLIITLVFSLDVSSQLVPETLGIQTKNHSSSTVDIENIKNTGVRYIRRGFIWENVEKQIGVYDFSHYDRIVQDAEERGLHILGTLYGGNDSYEFDGLGGIQTEEGRKGFAAFSAALAERYKDKNIIWEIWNEPNTLMFWRENPFPTRDSLAGEYTALVKETVPAMLAADPGCFVMAGSVSAFWEPSYTWSDICFKKGIGETGIRGWSVHPYGLKTPEEYSAGYTRFREIFVENNMPEDFPIFNSERGFSLEKLDEGWSGGNVEKAEEYQAWHLVRQYLIDVMNDIKLSIWYEWDGPKFGVVYNGEKRKSYYACVKFVDELGGYSYAERLYTASPSDYLLLFENNSGDRKVVAWTSPPPGKSPGEFVSHTVEIPADFGNRVSVCDILGNKEDFDIQNNRVHVELTGSPKYISFPQIKNNAELSAIIWPGAPENVTSDSEWKQDTIPDFNPEKYNYRVMLPNDIENVPVLFAIPWDPNAELSISGAKTLNGPESDRTTTISVKAEDNTTQITYSIVFEKDTPVPAVWSYEYIVRNDSLLITGIPGETRIDDFINNLLSDSADLKYSVISWETGSDRSTSSVIEDQDILKVYTSDSSHLTGYKLKVSASGLDDSAILQSNNLDVTLNADEGKITGFPNGATIESVLNLIEVPETATLYVVNSNDEPVSLKMPDYEDNYIPTLVHSDVFFKVVAQDMQTVIRYQLEPDTGMNDIFVYSNLLKVHQEARLISAIPHGMNVSSFLSLLWSNQDATIKVTDHLGKERDQVEISSYFYVEVTSKDGLNKKKYYLHLQGEEGIHAYVFSDYFSVNQEFHEIYGISDSLGVKALLDSVVPAVGASVRVVSSEGFVKIFGNIEPESDRLKVISGNGNKTVTYELMEVPKYTISFNVYDSNLPAAEAELIINGDTLYTGSSGMASIKLANGEYEYQVSKGEKIATGSLLVENGALNIDVTIKEPVYPLLISVWEGEEPVPNAVIVIDGKFFLANGSGQVSIDLPSGSYDYTVSLSGYEDQTGSVTIEDNGKDLIIVFKGVSTERQLYYSIKILPNPSEGHFFINLPDSQMPVEVKLIDIHGKVLMKKYFDTSYQGRVEMENLEKGIYLLQVYIDEKIINKKIVIQ